MKNQFTISAAYQWSNSKSLTNHSEKAIKKIVETIKNRFSNNENGKFNYNVNYRKLRASAGRTMIESIYNRIESSQVVIIDISHPNSNVFIEAGIAIALSKNKEFQSVYFIKEQVENQPLVENLPSDLQGYFISEYSIDNKGFVIFKDSQSLRMSIESNVKEYFNAVEKQFDSIDEIFNEGES
jgi:hypothetical protein